MLAVEPIMAPEVDQVEKEKELITQELLEIRKGVATLKELNASLQRKINTHVCTIVVQLDFEDPAHKISRVMTELKISKD